MPPVKSLQDHLEDLNIKKSAKEQYSQSMKYPIDMLLKIFSSLYLNGRPVDAVDNANSYDVEVLTDALKPFGENLILTLEVSIS